MQGVTKLRLVLDTFRRADHDIPILAITTFLLIGGRTGISLKELEKQTGMSKSSSSRITQYLSTKHWKKDKETDELRRGLDLIVVVQDPMDGRQSVCALTTKGQRLLSEINLILEK